MRAAFYESIGSAREVLQVGELPTPAVGAGEVRVRLHAAAVNPVDGYLRAGLLGPMPFPRVVPGFDGAGVVDAAGEGTTLQPGERVWVYNGQWQRAHGTAADYVSLPEQQVVPLPASMSFAEGATLGVAACTAQIAISIDGPVEGQTVLVAGGAGATSIFAIQLARLYGAKVIATVSSEQKAEVALAAGAHFVVDYRAEPDVAAAITRLTEGRGVDRIIEVALGANFLLDAAVLAPGGIITAYASPGAFTPPFPLLPLMWKQGRVRVTGGFAPTDADLAAIRSALAAGKLRPRIWKRYPLEEIVRAHEDQDANRPIGKIVLDIREEGVQR
ncbi:MAG: NADPH:quinone reductase [Deltaproteobacteria bacterium]|nr:NADPH:quinone reductase [Nannocystaceae bacterium]